MPAFPDTPSPGGRSRILVALALTVATGLAAGLGGLALSLLLHSIQHLAFGYSLDALVGKESFLDGVSAASPGRRLGILCLCGLVAGGGWWALYRFGRPLQGLAQLLKDEDPRPPPASTLIHALLQIVTVALGSPLGREVAPREIGAACSAWLSRKAGLDPEQRRILLACGAGAGLAAVYNVPLAGAVFTLEVLLLSFSWRTVAPAILSSVIAAMVAWPVLGNGAQYSLPPFVLSPSLLVWSLASGPLTGAAAYGFTRLAGRARAGAARGWRLPLFAVLNFAIVGALSMRYPALLGNGKGPAQAGFDNTLGVGVAATLMLLKVAVSCSSLRAGASGGLLTPGLSIGAMLAIATGGGWSLFWPGVPSGEFALVGAASFLAASMRMPLTAVVLVLELTHAPYAALPPILLAVAGAIASFQRCAAVSATVKP
ncbi:chloride channel protein [Paludibacterium yongneupense]|uniref:chloride channel protein n=1 Tax=Paludibacterium yongneupense TaxID=400061 RepID=UPI0004015AF6|nr:chloride channel protein [Paludibacterium yongneupense]